MSFADILLNLGVTFSPENIVKYLLSAGLAFLPVLIWIDILRHHMPHDQKKAARWLFLIGMLSALPILGFYYAWLWYFHGDLLDQISQNISNVYVGALLVFMVAGFFEEVVKNSVLRYCDHFILPIKTINEAVKFSIFAALGFAFAENIIYFSRAIGTTGFLDIFVIVVFRSIFTICAHMVFSGILGYYYSIAKFADPFIEEERWEGRRYSLIEFINKKTGVSKSVLYRKLKILQGVLLAASLHAFFNYLLDFQQLQYATLLVVAGFIYVYYLMTRKAGHLLLGYTKQRKSLMAPRDEDVVVELLGMWINEGKFAEVESICNRLLALDPDNKVVKIFLAKAHDKKKLRHAFNAIKALFSPDDLQEPENILEQKNSSTNPFTKNIPVSPKQIPQEHPDQKGAIPKESANQKIE